MTQLEARCLMALEITAISSCIRHIREPEPGLTIHEPDFDEDNYVPVGLQRWGDREIAKSERRGFSA